MSTEKIYPKIISYIFHPLLLPVLGLFLVFNLDETGLWLPSSAMRMFLYAATFTATFLFPLLSALLLLRLKFIASLDMKTKDERKYPYLITVVFYFSESYFLMHSDVSVFIKALMFGATLLVASIFLINLFWKISAHMAGIGGLCGMMIAVSFRLQINLHFVLIALFLIAGFVAFARLKLSAHNPAQVYIGFFLGVFVQLILFL